MSLADWPRTFTNNFSFWIELEDRNPTVTESGIARLDEYGLWIQIIDETGREVFSHNRPNHFPTEHSASELIGLDSSGYYRGSTIFTGNTNESGEIFSYIIGFPYNIGVYTLHFNAERVGRLFPVAITIALAAIGALIIFSLSYGLWLSQKVSVVMNGIKNISVRAYNPIKESGMFHEIYNALNKMDKSIKESDKLREDTENARKEWITNITHDLKTPLSPIKGYAELLTGDCDTDNVKEYGTIILKNAVHTEKLINDLKLTYQLDSGAFPFTKQNVRLTRYLKEIVIDIVNDPAFLDRNIEFDSNCDDLEIAVDSGLFRRAVQNIIINALIHNTKETQVESEVELNVLQNIVYIRIRDNGVGMTETEQSQLFRRYFRGTSTKERSEGSGLGLAIAKQIVELHSGEITVTSEPHEGTEFIISMPACKN
jgi:signal transduction histidine kinase